MKQNAIITDAVEFFLFNILADYRRVRKQEKSAAGFRNMFKTKDFLDSIFQLKDLKAEADSLYIQSSQIETVCQQEILLIDQLNLCLDLFQQLMDCKIQVNKCLERKINGDKSGKEQYKSNYFEAENLKRRLNPELLRLDDLYSDYTKG